MKLLLIILVLLLVISQNSFGQDTTDLITARWNSLKTQLQRRSDIIVKFTNFFEQSNKVAQKQLSNSKLFAVDLSKYIDTLNVKDSISISHLILKNSRLKQALSKTIDKMENDKKIWANDVFTEFLVELEGIENRIYIAKSEFIDIYKKYKRTDFSFDLDKPEKAPVIKF